jgi:hypothetical protein
MNEEQKPKGIEINGSEVMTIKSGCWHIIDRKTREIVGMNKSSTPYPGHDAVVIWLDGERQSAGEGDPASLYNRYWNCAWKLEAIAHEDDIEHVSQIFYPKKGKERENFTWHQDASGAWFEVYSPEEKRP